MILIKNFEIQNNGDNIYLDIETNIGSTITSILLWNLNTFKDYTQAINLSDKIIGTSNIEQIKVTADELDIIKFEDIWFVEIQSNNETTSSGPFNSIFNFVFNTTNTNVTTLEPALGITYNLNPYYNCLLNRFLTHTTNECLSSNEILLDDVTLSISLLIDMIEMGIEQGYYLQIIDLLAKVKKLCSIQKCNNCEQTVCTSCSKFKQI